MDTVYSSLIKKKVFNHFHAATFVTRKNENEKASLKNLKIKFRKNNYDSMLALSNFVSDLKKSGISSLMLKKILDNRKDESKTLVNLRNKFSFQIVILSITAMGIMWSWGLKSQDDLLLNGVNNMVSVSLSDVDKKEKKQIESRVEQEIKKYSAEKLWVITALNYMIFFLMLFCIFFLWVIFLNKSEILIDKIIKDALIYMQYEECETI